MNTILNSFLAAEQIADLRRSVAESRFAKVAGASELDRLTLRRATRADALALMLLAELDEEPELEGEVLLALLDGKAIAAISLDDGRVVADPFVATGGAVSLLGTRARQLTAADASRPRRRWFRSTRARSTVRALS